MKNNLIPIYNLNYKYWVFNKSFTNYVSFCNCRKQYYFLVKTIISDVTLNKSCNRRWSLANLIVPTSQVIVTMTKC